MENLFDGRYQESEFELNDNMYSVILEDIKYDFTPGCRGSRDSLGVPEEPDDPPEYEFIEACTIIIERYFDDNSETSETSEVEFGSPEFDEVLEKFLNVHKTLIEIYIAENER